MCRETGQEGHEEQASGVRHKHDVSESQESTGLGEKSAVGGPGDALGGTVKDPDFFISGSLLT